MHSPDGKKRGGADAESFGGPLVMQVVMQERTKMEQGTIAAVLIFPRPWPPLGKHEFFSRKEGDSKVHLAADGRGRLIFSINHSGQTTRTYQFQPIILQGAGRVILTLSWSQSGASLRLNEHELLLDHDSQGKELILKTSDDPVKIGRVLGDIDPNVGSSEAEFLFLATLVDIDQRVAEGGRYNLIRAAGLLRQLLLDERPILHEVNRTHRLKIEFETIDHSQGPHLTPDAHAINLDASFFPGAKTITVGLDTLLKAPCFKVANKIATVRDLIRACANAKGGVHLGKARTAEEDLILDWDQTFRLIGEEPSLLVVAGICRIVLKGLQPLVSKFR